MIVLKIHVQVSKQKLTHRVLKAHFFRVSKVLFSNSTSASFVLVPSAWRRTSGLVTAALASAMMPSRKSEPAKFTVITTTLNRRRRQLCRGWRFALASTPACAHREIIIGLPTQEPIKFELRIITRFFSQSKYPLVYRFVTLDWPSVPLHFPPKSIERWGWREKAWQNGFDPKVFVCCGRGG